MASKIQSDYISDLAVKKTKEFKEVKEILLASDIVGTEGENPMLIRNAQTIAEITHAMTDSQASKFIDVLTALKEPTRQRVYARKRIEKTVGILDDIKGEIADWNFDGLR